MDEHYKYYVLYISFNPTKLLVLHGQERFLQSTTSLQAGAYCKSAWHAQCFVKLFPCFIM